jgi:hypothetical protein
VLLRERSAREEMMKQRCRPCLRHPHQRGGVLGQPLPDPHAAPLASADAGMVAALTLTDASQCFSSFVFASKTFNKEEFAILR